MSLEMHVFNHKEGWKKAARNLKVNNSINHKAKAFLLIINQYVATRSWRIYV